MGRPRLFVLRQGSWDRTDGYAIECNRGFDDQCLSTMPIMTWYTNHLKPLFANRDLFKRALCRRSFLIIVGTYLHRALQHNQAVNLTSVVPVPGPNRSGIAERQVRLSNLIIPHHILPIFSHDFREKSSFVDQLVNFMNTHTSQHDKTLLSDEY